MLKMDQPAETQGTGLPDVFRILMEVPRERLLSLTFQLRESPEESIVHALSLIFLRKDPQALDQLRALRDNSLAKHLAEKWHTSAGDLEDFKVKCDDFQDAAKIQRDLARIFKVLSEQRLCDPHLRDLAYRRAISALGQNTIDFRGVGNADHLMDEAKQVCGPQFVETMCPPSPHQGELSREISALSLSQGESGGGRSPPSSLHGDSSTASYPTHLEISVPPTATFLEDKTHPVSSERPRPCADEPENSAAASCAPPGEARPKSIEPDRFKAENDSKMDARGSAAARCGETDGRSDQGLNHTRTVAATAKPGTSAEEEEEEEEEEQAVFYSFVILHAMEDTEMAESMKEKLEPLCPGVGATFSEDFAVPGRSTLTCLEDAINNSAFTILLLTRNFKTRLFEVEAESALVNSINKKHKSNTVIPLLPQENCMSRQNMSIVLQTLVPLEENKNFEKKIKKALSPVKIKAQRKVWVEEQRVKDLLRRREKLKQRLRASPLDREAARDRIAASYVGPHIPNAPGSEQQDGTLWWSQQPSIHIENAKYIMIGNDSQMTVELGGVDNGDN